MKRKLVSILLIVSLVCSFNFSVTFGITDEATEDKENTETNVENMVWEEEGIIYTLDPEGTLTVSGTGPTQDYCSWEDDYSPVSHMRSIKKVIIEEGITRVGNELFDECINIEEVSFPTTLKALGDQSFSGCERLKTVEIPNSVTDFGYIVFDDCRGLTEFVVADDHPILTVVDGVLFNKDKTVLLDYPGAKDASTYDVPEGVKEIYHYAFDECNYLQQVTFPSTLITIGDEAFHECMNLMAIDIPEGVERIGGGAFQECKNLSEISLPTTLRFLNAFVFQNTAYYNDLENWEDYVLYIDTVLVEGKYLDEESNRYDPTGDLVIKDGTTMIAGESFGLNDELTSISLPDSLKHVCQGAFFGCDNLVEVELPAGLQTLDDTAFYLCDNLSEVTMGTQLTYIGQSVFEGSIYQNNSNNYMDGILYNNGNLIVAGSIITAECTIKDDTRLIAGNAFTEKDNLTKVNIPESVKYICNGAFKDCDKLKAIEIPESVTFIGEHAFGYDYYTTSMDEIYTKYSDFTISGYLDTEAHRYAMENDIPFVNLAENPGEDEGGEDSEQPGTCNHTREEGFPYVPPTCTEPGFQFGCYCLDCGKTLIEREVLEAPGHFESTLLRVDPTCTEPGLEEGKECSVCHEVLVPQEVIPAYGHASHEKIEGYPATCTESGLSDGYKCTCGEIVTPQEVIPAACKLETKVESQATTAVDGKLVKKCTLCGEVDSEEIIGQAVVSLSQDTFAYDGQEKSPEVIVKDRFGNEISTDNYRITSSSGRTNVGQYTYGIEFKNQYVGYVVLTMKINPAGTSIQQTWSDSTAINVVITQVAADNTNVTGYELRCSTKEDFSQDVKTVQTSNTYDLYRTFNDLQPNTAYYFQVRTYKKWAGEYYYSDWSDTVYRMTKGNTVVVPPIEEPDESVCKEHDWDSGIVKREANCKTEGIKIFSCQKAGCNEKKTEIIPKTKHDIVTDAAVDATCTKTGLTAGEHCTKCNYKIVQTTIAKKAHSGAITETTKATTKKNGITVIKCTCGKLIKTTAIFKVKTIKLAKTSVAYTGKAQKVKVTVKDADGKTIKSTNYVVSYKNNKKVGKATVTVKFKGNYTGTKTLHFKINPKAPTIKKPSVAKKAVTVKWGKVAKETTGYEVMIATNKKFTQGKKSVIVKSSKITSKKISKLKAKKSYHIKVRSYKKVGKEKYYSNWSDVKMCKVK